MALFFNQKFMKRSKILWLIALTILILLTMWYYYKVSEERETENKTHNGYPF